MCKRVPVPGETWPIKMTKLCQNFALLLIMVSCQCVKCQTKNLYFFNEKTEVQNTQEESYVLTNIKQIWEKRKISKNFTVVVYCSRTWWLLKELIKSISSVPEATKSYCNAMNWTLTLYLEHSSLTPLKYPSSGILTPASPWIGSTMNAQVFGSLIHFYKSKSFKRKVWS